MNGVEFGRQKDSLSSDNFADAPETFSRTFTPDTSGTNRLRVTLWDGGGALVKATSDLEQGREAYEALAWAAAYECLSRADQAVPLRGGDLELLATSAHMLGRVDEWLPLLERAHQSYAEEGEPLRAVRCAFWIGMQLLMRRPEIEGFISIAPPANLYDFSFLAPCPSSGLIIHGDINIVGGRAVVVDLAQNAGWKISRAIGSAWIHG